MFRIHNGNDGLRKIRRRTKVNNPKVITNQSRILIQFSKYSSHVQIVFAYVGLLCTIQYNFKLWTVWNDTTNSNMAAHVCIWWENIVQPVDKLLYDTCFCALRFQASFVSFHGALFALEFLRSTWSSQLKNKLEQSLQSYFSRSNENKWKHVCISSARNQSWVKTQHWEWYMLEVHRNC